MMTSYFLFNHYKIHTVCTFVLGDCEILVHIFFLFLFKFLSGILIIIIIHVFLLGEKSNTCITYIYIYIDAWLERKEKNNF
jgi:hypothetical protein